MREVFFGVEEREEFGGVGEKREGVEVLGDLWNEEVNGKNGGAMVESQLSASGERTKRVGEGNNEPCSLETWRALQDRLGK